MAITFTPKANISNITELCLYKPHLREHEFIEDCIDSIYRRILDDTLSNLLNINENVDDSLYTDTSAPTEEIGLKDYIIKAWLKSGKINLEVESVGGEIVYSPKVSIVGLGVLDSILVIDGTTAKTRLLYDYFLLINQYIRYCNNSIHLANKPVIKFNNMRAGSNAQDIEKIESAVQHTISSLKAENGVAILDAKDIIEFSQIDPTTYKVLLDIGYQGASFILGLPSSYVFGEQKGGLNTTGEGDRVILERTLFSLYQNKIRQILKRVYFTQGLEYDIIYKKYDYANLKAGIGLLPLIERSELITKEKKIELVKSLIN